MALDILNTPAHPTRHDTPHLDLQTHLDTNQAIMPSKTASKPADASNRGTGGFVDDYLADWDNDDPFRSPSPEPASTTKEPERKTDTLGIDQELDLKKKPRVPRVKLDETR